MHLSKISLALRQWGNVDPNADIKALFANGEEGAWYDPSDLTTMFQDLAGATPVTADGQPVGLILDKSKGLVLGPELVGTPITGIATSGGNWVFGTDTVSGTNTHMGFNIDISSGTSSYKKITFTASNISGGTCYVTLIGPSAASTRIGANGTYTFILKTQNSLLLSFVPYEGSNGSLTLSNISVEEIAGNHATAPSDAARPLYKVTGLAKWNDFDAVDDVLNTTFPSSLGSSCTVCRANVGAAPTILTAQTIGTSYADSTDNAGLIIINRALTAQETTDVTAWLTAKGATA